MKLSVNQQVIVVVVLIVGLSLAANWFAYSHRVPLDERVRRCQVRCSELRMKVYRVDPMTGLNCECGQ